MRRQTEPRPLNGGVQNGTRPSAASRIAVGPRISMLPTRSRTQRPVRIAIVGIGYWGPNLVRNLYELPEAEPAWICDVRLEALEAVVIATPISTHSELAAAALRADKHVFVEKPLAASSQEGLKLIRLASRRNLLLMPGHTFLYSPPVNMIRDMIAAEELGEIYFISMSRVNLGIHQSDVSVAWDLGPHDFSILRYWLNETPSHISALSRACIMPDTPDVAFMNLEFPSGAIAHVELSWLAPSKLRRTTIVGSRKMVVYDDMSNEPVRVFDSGVNLIAPETFGEYMLSYRTGDIISPNMDPSEPLLLEFADFCAAIRTGSQPRSHATLGLDVVRMIEATDRSLAAQGSRLTVEHSAELETISEPYTPADAAGLASGAQYAAKA